MAGTLQLLLQTAYKRYSLLGNYTRLLMGSRRRSLHQPNLHRSKTLPTRPQSCPASTPRIGKLVKLTTSDNFPIFHWCGDARHNISVGAVQRNPSHTR